MAIESITYHGDGEFNSIFVGDNKLDSERVVEKYNKATSKFKTPIHIHLLKRIDWPAGDFSHEFEQYNIDTSEGIHLGLTGNAGGVNPLPLTPWIIMHRSMHHLLEVSRFSRYIDGIYSYEEVLFNEILKNHNSDLSVLNKCSLAASYLSSFKDKKFNISWKEKEDNINNINSIIYNRFESIAMNQISMRFHHYVYTMKSARDSALDHPERLNECLCQYIINGKVTIRHPNTLPEGLISDEVYNQLIEMHEPFEKQINSICKNILDYYTQTDTLVVL